MHKSASRNSQRALAGPTYKYSAREKAKKLSPRGSDEDERKPRRYKSDAAAKAARGRDQPPEARMRGVVVQKVAKIPNGKTVRITRKCPDFARVLVKYPKKGELWGPRNCERAIARLKPPRFSWVNQLPVHRRSAARRRRSITRFSARVSRRLSSVRRRTSARYSSKPASSSACIRSAR